jgi:hypothetical protein
MVADDFADSCSTATQTTTEVFRKPIQLLRGQDLRLFIEKGTIVLGGTTGHFMSTYLLTSE